MAIKRDLVWFLRADEFEPNDRRVLLAMSFEEHRWRTIDDILALTRLDYDEVSSSLARLMKQSLVMGSFDYRIQEPAFGLVERNDSSFEKGTRTTIH